MSSIEVFFKSKFGKSIFYLLQIVGIIFAYTIAYNNDSGILGWLLLQSIVIIIGYFLSHFFDIIIYRSHKHNKAKLNSYVKHDIEQISIRDKIINNNICDSKEDEIELPSKTSIIDQENDKIIKALKEIL